ncbi:hypothetical protein HU200_025859 [Digitaria exilis]|uniref:Uncharacterized protein n=1 Tax=Digitaria exilis TaxID=1010633 RepID=A0A835EVR3_9POAL|nr:hypothetical protein HU200_025859 [Digitaria exilis]
MQTASIFRDTNNDATQSNFTKQFTAHCSVNPHDPATSFPTKANEAVCTTASNSSEDASVNPESTKKNTTDAVAPQSPLGLDHRVFFELPSSFAETPDCLKVPELFHGFLETLQPLDIWEGFDLGVQEDMLMDEIKNQPQNNQDVKNKLGGAPHIWFVNASVRISMAVAIMESQLLKHDQGNLTSQEWGKLVLQSDIAVSFIFLLIHLHINMTC